MDNKKQTAEEKKEQQVQDALDYSGIAINDADNQKVNKELIKDRTRTLNNNPRNNEI